MNLGNFSLSLEVKDINASLEFYKKLGFKQIMGDLSQKWCVVRNGECTIGLFQGMFDSHILTFNPKWDADFQENQNAPDIREIEAKLRAAGIEPVKSFEYETTGPAHFVIEDPDGHTIMFEQYL
ncbi:VOC family protein [Macrococcus equipercicus]|uniref:VOC family protein n=1 Tax=Macrococcus equipercicus TaxID=69967 RepID=A0ABQ6R6X9_9STAP|nr:VOC family protein [Macrococcus equipercicus]KAA1037604.1 VOC family protein [Macrococcus equipercicus]